MGKFNCSNPSCKRQFSLTDTSMVIVGTEQIAALCFTCASTQARVEAQIVEAICRAEKDKDLARRQDKLTALRQRRGKLVRLQPYSVRQKFDEYCEKWRAIGPQDGLLEQAFFNLLDEMEDSQLKGKQTLKWAGRYFLFSSGLERAAFLAVKKGSYQFHDALGTRIRLAKTCDPMVAGFTLEDLKDSGSKARHLTPQARADMAKELNDRKKGKRRPRRKPEPKVEVVVEPEPVTPPPLPETAGNNGGNGKDEGPEALVQQPFASLAAKADEAAPVAPDGTPAN